jgi:FkbM family methyltransferase
MALGRSLTKPRVIGLAVILSGLVALVAVGGYWRLRTDCECAPSQFENTTYLYQITHFERMATVYYGQFYEDYILAYVFKNQKNGFYIDVGANDPNKWNTTRYFYERGWRGINIEPNALEFRKIVESRPRDINYNVGVANIEGTMTFYQVAGSKSGLSTFDRDEAQRLTKERGIVFTELPVQLTTLNALLAKTSIPQIEFLSIDVEGFEKQVIESIDLVRYKPAVLCIEATQPLSEVAVYGAWEPLVLKARYLFAMSDGLNRYYVHRNRLDLLSRFIFVDMCVKQSKLKRHVRMDGIRSWDK